MEFINDDYETNKKQMKTQMAEVRTDTRETNENVIQLQKDLDDLHDSHIDLQTRSIRENLIVTGIPQTEQIGTNIGIRTGSSSRNNKGQTKFREWKMES